LMYSERPIKILDMVKQVTRNKVIKMCKVHWSHHTEDEATWEHEDEIRADYLSCFCVCLNLEGKIPFKRG
jgi:hypothetical protein